MEIAGTTAFVTGANRGLGRHLAEQLRDRGATVYGGARNPASVELSGVIPIALDVTDIESVAAPSPPSPATWRSSSTMPVRRRGVRCLPGTSHASGSKWTLTTSAR